MLREMIKSTNFQLKAREQDKARLKFKLTSLEGKNYATSTPQLLSAN